MLSKAPGASPGAPEAAPAWQLRLAASGAAQPPGRAAAVCHR